MIWWPLPHSNKTLGMTSPRPWAWFSLVADSWEPRKRTTWSWWLSILCPSHWTSCQGLCELPKSNHFTAFLLIRTGLDTIRTIPHEIVSWELKMAGRKQISVEVPPTALCLCPSCRPSPPLGSRHPAVWLQRNCPRQPRRIDCDNLIRLEVTSAFHLTHLISVTKQQRQSSLGRQKPESKVIPWKWWQLLGTARSRVRQWAPNCHRQWLFWRVGGLRSWLKKLLGHIARNLQKNPRCRANSGREDKPIQR